jgi:hypothetical protein
MSHEPQAAAPCGASEYSPREWRMILLAALAAAALCVLNGDRRGFWLDEYYTLHAARLAPGALIADRIAVGHSPLYFFYAKWPQWIGHEEWILRLSSSITIFALVIFVAALAAELGLRRRLAPLLAFCVAHPFWIMIGTMYRYMAPLTAAAAATAWTAARFARRGGARERGDDGRDRRPHALDSRKRTDGDFRAGAGARVAFARRRGTRSARALGRALWPPALSLAASAPLAWILAQGIRLERPKYPRLDGAVKDLMETLFGPWSIVPESLGLPHALWLLPAAGLLAWIVARSAPGARRPGGVERRAAVCVFLHAGNSAGRIPHFRAHSRRAGTGEVYRGVFDRRPPAAGRRLGRARRAAFARAPSLPRLGLCGALAIQMTAALANWGDLQREGVRWILARRQDAEPVLISTQKMNRLAFEYHGMKDPRALYGVDGRERRPEAIRAALREAFGESARGFVFLYHARGPFHAQIQALEEGGFFAAARGWRLGGEVRVFAVARGAQEREWLESLPAPGGGAWLPWRATPLTEELSDP